MRCPRCGHLDDRVIDSRQSPPGDNIRRRRECLACTYRFTTYERLEVFLPQVVKRDGRREPYQREKLLAGLVRACEKRPISADALNQVADRIERHIGELGVREVEAKVLGDALMEELKGLDGVAYVRFASVYRSYSDISEFLTELASMVEPGSRRGEDAP